MSRVGNILALAVFLLSPVGDGHAITLKEAVEHTIQTNPSIASSAAARAATDYQLRQARGRFLPTVDIQGDTGSQKVIKDVLKLDLEVNDQWRHRRLFDFTVRQTLFQGWDRANDVYKNAARVDAAALRVLESSQTLALNAVEAYIDVRRTTDILSLARENVRRHQNILQLVKVRKEGGKAPVSEVDQTEERVAAAEGIISEITQSFLEAKAKYRRIIGLEPGATSPVGYPAGLQLNRQSAIDTGIANNPSIRVAGAESDVARYEFKQSKSSYFPTVGLEGTSSWARNLDGTPGRDDELIGKLVLSWNLFDGLIKVNRRRELAERWTEAQLERDVRIREIIEVIDRALASYETGGDRVKSFEEQVAANIKVVKTYFEEYELSKRSLLDLLDSESAMFNSQFQLTNTRAIHKFASYQLLAGTGQLLRSLGVEPPEEAFSDGRIRRIRKHRYLGKYDLEIEPLKK